MWTNLDESLIPFFVLGIVCLFLYALYYANSVYPVHTFISTFLVPVSCGQVFRVCFFCSLLFSTFLFLFFNETAAERFASSEPTGETIGATRKLFRVSRSGKAFGQYVVHLVSQKEFICDSCFVKFQNRYRHLGSRHLP